MKISDILLSAGAAVIKNAVPGGGLILDVISNFLPESKKLDKNVTGEQAMAAISTLPPDQQLSLLEKELDVEIAEINNWSQIQGSLASADMAGASTRPKIAIMMARIVSFAVIVFVAIWSVAILNDQQEMVNKLSDSWPLMLAILATPTALLRAYFGMRTKEKRTRYQAAIGQSQTNVFAEIIKAIRK